MPTRLAGSTQDWDERKKKLYHRENSSKDVKDLGDLTEVLKRSLHQMKRKLHSKWCFEFLTWYSD